MGRTDDRAGRFSTESRRLADLEVRSLVAEHVQRYVDAGVTTPIPMILAAPDQAREVARALSPAAR